jgi:predicted hydrolase (HD superfamily)
MLTREEAIKLVNEHLKDDKLVKHILAAEAIMRNNLTPRRGRGDLGISGFNPRFGL